MALPTSIIKDMQAVSPTNWAEEAGLNWEAEKVPLHYFGNDNVSRTSSMRSIIRNDTGQELGVVSDKYQIVQPSHILEGFEESCASLGAGFNMDGIGIFGNGKIIWGRAKSDQPIMIKGQDHIDSYLYMVTSFDGSVATMGFVSTLRTVCSNALHLAQKRGDKLFNVSHRSKYRGQAVSALDTYMNTLGSFEESANKMANIRTTPKDTVRFMTKLLYPTKTEFSEREKTTVGKYIDAVVSGAGSGLSSVGADHNGVSLWGVVNGVTNIIDNNPIRKSEDDKSSFLGSGNALKAKAWAQALKIAA